MNQQADKINSWLDGGMLLAGLSALGCLIVQIGWPLDESKKIVLGWIVRFILTSYVLQELLRWLMRPKTWAALRERSMETMVAALSLVVLTLERPLMQWMQELLPRATLGSVALLYLAFSQVPVVFALFFRLIKLSGILQKRTLPPGILLMGSFAVAILLGTLFLKMPNSTTPEGIAWVDALFLSTSAICVTGLSPLDISLQLTQTGRTILLFLVQCGGLGIITLTYFFAMVFAQGISLRDRVLLVEFLSEDNIRQIALLLFSVIVTMAAIEILGTWFLFFSLREANLTFEERCYTALFHSISAFCNAGFSIYSKNLADPLVADNKFFLGTVMALIILGSLGFPVLKELSTWGGLQITRLFRSESVSCPRLSLHSRLVLTTTSILLAAGAVLMFLTEWLTGRSKSWLQIAWESIFNSVTARTAGFNIAPIETLAPPTVMVLLLLMYVGGSPAGTAGGIKTTTFTVAMLNLHRILKDRSTLHYFHRTISDGYANKAFSIMLLAGGWVMMVSMLLMLLHPDLPALDLFFEAVSAFGTVGLSRAITPELGWAAKFLIILTMFVGRVGILLFAVSLLKPDPEYRIRYPEAGILLN